MSHNFPSNEENYDSGYGYNYRNYRLPNEAGLKGKIEQKYWRSKQKVIEKLGKEQDEFVIAGDAEVDARLEAFQHIKMTCMQLMVAVEFYQNKIFALSQDENEMGRFLRDQGSLDKTKAGKMMIAVGKAQSYAAQQRLGLRASLARLFSELETFRFRAIQDTQITVTKMEQARSDYRARLLWMADISKEVDPDQMKRLDKFRDVQLQVKLAKTLFDKLKGDVVQKIDLLSASRCNLLSATLEPYQTAMITFLRSTSKSYNSVYQQFEGYPSFQFQVLKNIIPNNGIVDDDEETEINEENKEKDSATEKIKSIEAAEEIKETDLSVDDDEADDKLINFDTSPSEENTIVPGKVDQNEDLLGSLATELSPGFGEYSSGNTPDNKTSFDDLLGRLVENNTVSSTTQSYPVPSYGMALLGGSDDSPPNTHMTKSAARPGESNPSVDDLLFGLPNQNPDNSTKSDMDLLSDVLNNHSLGINDMELNNSFSSQWQSMFGSTEGAEIDGNISMKNVKKEAVCTEGDLENQMFMPSFLLDQIGKAVPMNESSSKGMMANKDPSKYVKPTTNLYGNQKNEPQGKDMSAWFSLFADLDPLSNPDAVGACEIATDGKQAC